MTAPVSNINNTQAPVGAFGLGGSKKHEPGGFVVYPPEKVYKYSVYDELELGKDRYKELLGSLESKSAVRNKRRTRTQMIFSKIINWGIILGGGILAYKYRSSLKNMCINIYNKIKGK